MTDTLTADNDAEVEADVVDWALLARSYGLTKLTYSPREVWELMSISESQFWKLARADVIELVPIGPQKRVVRVTDIARLLKYGYRAAFKTQ
jgi:hypothetical protein